MRCACHPVPGEATRPGLREWRSSSSAHPISATIRARTSKAGAIGGVTRGLGRYLRGSLVISAVAIQAALDRTEDARYDLLQKRRAVLRYFPLVGHFRYLLEAFGPRSPSAARGKDRRPVP